jgi:hypothetical protein
MVILPSWTPTAKAHHSHGEPIVMTSSNHSRRNKTTFLGGFTLLFSLALTGCQVDIAGQTLPSGFYLDDDVQYFSPDAEFKLSREAAALKEQAANQISSPQTELQR